MQIKGIIQEVIQKENLPADMGVGDDIHYMLLIRKTDFPDNFFKQIIYRFKNKLKEYEWFVLTREEHKVENFIELEAEPLRDDGEYSIAELNGRDVYKEGKCQETQD